MPRKRTAIGSLGSSPKRSKPHVEKAARVKEMDRLAWLAAVSPRP